VAQISISLPLLLGAGLCVRSLRKAELINPGFETENVLVFSVSPRSNGYSDTRATVFYKDLLERLRGIRGVQSVSLTALLPLSYGELQENVEVKNNSTEPQQVVVSENLVAADYFQTLGVAVVRGRAFESDRDRHDVVINETFARSFFPGQNPIGRQLKVGGGLDARWVQIIGIARDSKYRTLGESTRPLFYAFLTPGIEGPTGTAVLIRTFASPIGLIPAIRSQVHALDNNMPMPRIETMGEHIGSALWLARTTAGLFAVLGMMGAFLAMIGLYGTVAYSVSRRTNEIGVRMALGAEPADILRMIEGEGLILTCMGTGIGLAAAFGLTRFLGSLLYGVSATDPLTFAAVSILFTVVALAACYIPAKRATRVDPMAALKYE
jgi:predicted permease